MKFRVFLFPSFILFFLNFSAQAFEVVPGEILVKIADAPKALRALSKYEGEGSVSAVAGLPRLYKLKLKTPSTQDQLMNQLKTDSMIEYAEPNYLFTTNQQSDGPEFNSQWAYKTLELASVWDLGIKGSHQIKVGILDTGIDWNHPDLINNLFTNAQEIPGNGVDDDNNGFIDDIHGWNFVNGTPNSQDDNKHGTHVSGIAGAVGGNDIGVAGVAWEMSLVPLKFLDDRGRGTLEHAIEAIGYARQMGVQIMNCSWSAKVTPPRALQEAVELAGHQNMLFVVAAGNDSMNIDQFPVSPASIHADNVLVVAATDSSDTLAVFSNYGIQTVHVAAPGVGIMSTLPQGKYGLLSGTSMATPHMTGLATLLLANEPELTALQIRQRIMKSSARVPKLRRLLQARGRANALNAISSQFPDNTDPSPTDWISEKSNVKTAHPYGYNENRPFIISIPGAKAIRAHLSRYQVEVVHDSITLENPAGDILEKLEGEGTDFTTNYADGDTLILRLHSDMMINQWGFEVDSIDYIF